MKIRTLLFLILVIGVLSGGAALVSVSLASPQDQPTKVTAYLVNGSTDYRVNVKSDLVFEATGVDLLYVQIRFQGEKLKPSGFSPATKVEGTNQFIYPFFESTAGSYDVWVTACPYECEPTLFIVIATE